MYTNLINAVRRKPLLFCIVGVFVIIAASISIWQLTTHRDVPQTTETPATSAETPSPSGVSQNPTSNSTANNPATASPATTNSPQTKASNPQAGSTNATGQLTTPANQSPASPVVTTSSYPNASTTGPTGCSAYTTYANGYTITTDNTVLNCVKVTGTVYVNANNVTIQNSILTGTDWWGIRYGNTKANATGLKVLHSKLQTVAGQGPDNGGYDYGIAQESTGSMEIAYNDISGYKDGITASNSAYIHDNYIHGLSEFTNSHSQGIYVYAGQQVKIDHNTIINGAPQSQATAAIYIAPDDGHQNDRIVTNNLLGGGAYVIYGGDTTATNIVVTGNVFTTQITSNGGYYGIRAYWQAGNTGNTWSNNTWYDGPAAGQAAS